MFSTCSPRVSVTVGLRWDSEGWSNKNPGLLMSTCLLREMGLQSHTPSRSVQTIWTRADLTEDFVYGLNLPMFSTHFLSPFLHHGTLGGFTVQSPWSWLNKFCIYKECSKSTWEMLWWQSMHKLGFSWQQKEVIFSFHFHMNLLYDPCIEPPEQGALILSPVPIPTLRFR